MEYFWHNNKIHPNQPQNNQNCTKNMSIYLWDDSIFNKNWVKKYTMLEGPLKNKEKKQDREHCSQGWVGRLKIWLCAFKIEKSEEFTRSTTATKIGYPVFMIDAKVFKDKYIWRRVDGKNLAYIWWNSIRNCKRGWRWKGWRLIK